MKNKILTLLGFAAKAKKICQGLDLTVSEIKKNRVSLVLIASDISENSSSKLMHYLKNEDVFVSRIFTQAEISKAIGKDNRVVVGILDKQMASKMIEYLKQITEV